MKRPVVLLDLTAGPVARRLLYWQTRRILAGRQGGVVLVHDPASVSADLKWPERITIRAAGKGVTDIDRKAINEWALRSSREFIDRTRDLFPMVEDVSFGELAIGQLQDYWSEYAHLASFLNAATDEFPGSPLHVVTADRSLAAALGRQLGSQGQNATPWVMGRGPWTGRVQAWLGSLPRWLPRSGPELNTPSDLPPGGLLIVSESRPMAEMFTVLEPALALRGGGPILRLQYHERRTLVTEDSKVAMVLRRIRPERTLLSDPGAFWRSWMEHRGDVTDAVNRLESRWAGAIPPVEYFLEGLVLHSFPRMADHLRFACRLLDRAKPDLLVVGNDRWWVGLSFVLLARQRGITTICVQDGVPTDIPVWHWMAADYLAASSSWLPELLTSHGIAPERVRITGQPRYDLLVEKAARFRKDEIRSMLGLDPAGWYCVVATQPLQAPAYAREVISAILRVPDVRVLLRPHPSQAREELAAVADLFPAGRVTFHPGDSVFDLLMAGDLLVTEFSTVAIEAAIIGRPVITASFGGGPEKVPYARFGLSRAATTPDELRDAVADVLDAHRKGMASTAAPSARGVELLVGPADGHAAERTAEFILSLMPAARH